MVDGDKEKTAREKKREEMAENVMNAIQYEKYGGGPGGLKVLLLLLIKYVTSV